MRNNILKKIIVSIIIITGSVVEAYGISPVQYKLTATAIPTPTGEGSVYASTTSVSSVSETEWDNPKSVTISGYTWTAFSTEAYLYAKATATGYEFKGWGTSKTAVSPALTYDANNNNELTITFSGNRSSDATQTKEFYAIFGPEQYQISFSANGGTGTDPAQIPYTIESTGVTLPANPYTKTGYSFTGWQPTSNVGNWATSETYAAGATVSVGKYGNVTLTAQWTPITYTIKFAPGEHGSGTMSDATYNIAGTGSITSVPTSSFTAANGYEFSGWKVTSASAGSWTQNDPVSAGTSLTGKYGDVTLTAQWTPVEYTISFSGNGGTGTTPSAMPYTIESTGISLPANPYTKTGYTFSGWQPTSNVGNWATSETYAAGATVPAGKYGTVTLQAKWDEMVDIVISVTGLQSGESAIFTVAKGSTTLYTVALNSTKSSLTINDQEPGEYTVTPLSWSWTYSMSSPITKTITSSDHTFEFTATKNTSSKKHAEKSNVNWHTP